MTLFNFMLLPVEEITPWGSPDAPTLSWFGLSLGYFWLHLGGQEVLRARDGEPPYCDYQLARYWEDLLDSLPAVLEPVPADIVAMRDAPDWEQRCAKAEDALETEYSDTSEWWRIEEALRWPRRRGLDVTHLSAAPRVDYWRVDDRMYFEWSSRPASDAAWMPVQGTLSMPLQTFLDEVRDFDARLLSAMKERVRNILGASGIPGVSVDLEHLQKEQADRSTWLDAALVRSAQRQASGEGSDWEGLRRLLTPGRT